jgi:chromate transporter
MEIKKIRHLIFLRDVAWLSITAFGGPQVHVAMFLEMFVNKRRYLSEKDFLEINALCQILPGPTSSQIIVVLGYQIGGASLAYWTLLIWCMPGVLIMTSLGILISYLNAQQISLDFMRFVQPTAIGFVCYAALNLSQRMVNTHIGFGLMLLACAFSYFLGNPWVFPLTVVVGGLVTALKFREQEKEAKSKFRIAWGNFVLFVGVLVGVAIIGGLTRWLWIRLFENFYRNGSFIYGGGQVLIPVLFTEFVKFKKYLSEYEFLSGYALAQLVPGPVFSFACFIGVLTMRNEGIGWQIIGGLTAGAGIFLPGIFILFFVIRIWEHLKKYRGVKASVEGINAASSGLVIAGALLLFIPIADKQDWLGMLIVLLSFSALQFTRLSRPFLIFLGLMAGLIYQFVIGS